MAGATGHPEHREAKGLHICLNLFSDLLQMGAGADQADPEAHGLIAHLEEQPGPGRGFLPHDPHPLSVAAPSFLLDADVHTEQVARLQRNRAGLAAEGDLVVAIEMQA